MAKIIKEEERYGISGWFEGNAQDMNDYGYGYDEINYILNVVEFEVKGSKEVSFKLQKEQDLKTGEASATIVISNREKYPVKILTKVSEGNHGTVVSVASGELDPTKKKIQQIKVEDFDWWRDLLRVAKISISR